MKSFVAFTKKEMLEMVRTYRLMILGIVFLILALMSPLSAKLMPEIFASMGIDAVALGLAEPTMVDSWVQFFKNVSQIGLVVLVIIFSGIMATEFSKGTLVNVLTKGLKRRTVILSKMTAVSLAWSICYLLSLAFCYGFTAYYFDVSGMNNIFIAFFSFWVYGELLIALLIFGGALFKNIVGSLLVTGGAVILFAIIGIIPGSEKYNPQSLAGINVSLITGTSGMENILPAVFISIGLCALITFLTIIIFNKKQL